MRIIEIKTQTFNIDIISYFMKIFETRKIVSFKEIDAIKNQIIDVALIIGSILGMLAFLSSLENYIKNYSIVYFLLDFTVVSTFIFITIIRKRLQIKPKSIIIIFALFILIITDVFKLGAYSDNKTLIVLLPFIAFLAFSFRTTIILYIITILSFLILGFLYMSGKMISNIDFLARAITAETWIVNALLISIVSLVVIMVVRKFNDTFFKLIANLKIKNKKIVENERNYREIFNSSTDAIFIHNLNGGIIDVNDSMLEIYGYKADDIKSLEFNDLISGIDPYTAENAAKFINKATNEGKQVFDWQARKKTGEMFWVEVALKKTDIGGNERILAVVRDINEKKQTDIKLINYKEHLEQMVKERTQELEKANNKLQLNNKELHAQREQLELTLNKLQSTQDNLIQSEKMASLGVLALGVAHEINNPLNFIQGGINGIELYLDDNLDKKHLNKMLPFIDGIKEGVQRAANIVTSLNHYSRKGDSNSGKCKIHDIIDNCLVMLNSEIKNKIKIQKKYTKEPFNLECNDGKLHQVFLNILSNAEQAIEKKGTIKISTHVEKQNIKIYVNDTGTGIDKNIISKISDPFFTTKDVGKGTGLGLSIAYKIIEDNNGTIKHLSQKGEGTEVIITLPLKSKENDNKQ